MIERSGRGDARRGATRLGALGALCAALLLSPPVLTAQEGVIEEEGYLQPPEPVRDALLAPWHRNAELEDPSPDGRFFLVEVRDRRMPPLSRLAKAYHNLGGLQVDPAADRNRFLTIRSPDRFWLVDGETGDTLRIDAPREAPVSAPRWSPDGERLAFFVHLPDATHIYTVERGSEPARRLSDRPILATLVTDFVWSEGGEAIYAVAVPDDRGPEPEPPAVAPTPRVDVTTEGENQLRTYPSLLETPHERALLEYYATGQLVRIDVEERRSTPVGEPALIEELAPSPDGDHVLVTLVEPPFSKIVPVSRFATREEVWDRNGQVVAEVQSRPIRDGTESDDDPDRRREVAWRPDGGGLGFLQRPPAPEGEGDSDAPSGSGDGDSDDEGSDHEDERGDRIYRWSPPFDSASLAVVHESEHGLQNLSYSEDGSWLFVVEEDEEADSAFIVAVAPARDERRVLAAHDTEDPYDDPGDLVVRPEAGHAPVARVSENGRFAYVRGTTYPENPIENAPRPFLDRVEIETGDLDRLFESEERVHEDVVAVLDDEAERLLLRREASDRVPQYALVGTGEDFERLLTANADPAPDITGARREAIWAIRADGLRFKVEVAFPVGYAEGDRPPAVFWHYPREYEDEDDYRESIRTFNRNAFPVQRPRSMETLVRLGYAVVSPDVPIVGPRERWNDRYVVDLRNTLSATIDALDERGWIDRDRLAIGGHSYGGFGTINALVRTPFFKAGIAGAANSNRTLTPAGFQREPRLLWEARETYIRMSPLLWLNEMTGALLLYHGIDDQNVGTFPDHSIRSFHALNALGKTGALYMYPYEGHGPVAQESILDLWARWSAWLDHHVKDAEENEGDARVTSEENSGTGR